MNWRPMTEADLHGVAQIGNGIHQAYPEDFDVFASRFFLYPEGCRVLGDNGRLLGYVLSHPWRLFDPPKLNTVLDSMPEGPDTYYIHDLALLPETRGQGMAARIIDDLAQHAAAASFANSSLVAVGGTSAFWQKNHYRAHEDAGLAARLRSYDEEAAYMIRNLT